MNLYTIPYAGGFAFTYLKWKKYLDPSINLCLIELPGRNGNLDEPLCNTIEQMAERVLCQIKASNEEYCLFGHSMGAYVLLEVYSKLIVEKSPLPKHIIISGMKPPHLYQNKGYHLLDKASFKTKMCEMGGIPLALIEDEGFSEMLFDLLRNDVKAVEKYKILDEMPRFTCEVSLFNSVSDNSYESMRQWSQYSQKPCGYNEFAGTHFFINEHVSEVVNRINEILCGKLVLIKS